MFHVSRATENFFENMLGSYSYRNQTVNQYQFTDANGATAVFRIVPVNTAVANLQFLDAVNGNVVNVPPGFTLSDTNGVVAPFGAPTTYFIGMKRLNFFLYSFIRLG